LEENFLLDLVSALDQSRSQKRVNADIKTLEKTINMLHLTATLAKGSSKKEINAYIKTLSDQLSTIKLKAKIDSKNLKSEINSALSKVSFKDIDVLNIDGNKTKLKAQKVIADTKAYIEKNPINIGINYENRRNKLDNDLTAYLKRNSKIQESSTLLKEANNVRDLINAINDKKSLREATDAFQLYRSEVSATGFATKSTADRIKSMFGHITKLGGLFSVTSLAVNNFTKSLGTLKDIDDILTEISKTSNLTAQELERLGDISFKSASKYGKTASDYLTGIQEMSRSGFYGEKGTAMTEQSLLAQAAGDISADVANKYILATNAAYKFNGEAEKLNAALDGQNSITNRNSVALSDMAIAMSEAGTVASSYRVSIEDLSAMIGTMEAVTKLGGSEVGNGIKAILINLQNVNSSKITDTLGAANASMTEFVNGTEKLRDPISILRDLAETFNQLDEDDALRAEILTNIGGKHQAAKLAALLQNMEMFDKMLVDYSEGSGSAMEEAMKSANNWSGKINQIQNSWDSLVNSIISKDTVLNGLTFGDKLIQGAESFIDTFGTIPTILTAVNASLVTMRKDYGLTKIWDKENQKIDIEGNLFGIDISKIKNLKKHYKEAEEVILQWNDKLSNGKTDIESFNTALVQNSASLKEYLSTCSKDAPASLAGYKDYLKSTGQATEDLRLKTILLNTALTLLGSIAVQAVITGIANAFDKFNETVVESKEKVDGINSKISDLKTQLDELNSIEYKSDFDKQKISQLERELELQEKILEIEQKRLYQNQIGTRFSDYFDEDSLISKQQAENDRNNQDRYSNLTRWARTYESSLSDIDAELDSLQEKLSSEDLIGHNRFMTEGRIAELTEKRNDLLEKQQTIEDQLIVNMGEYLKNYQTAKEAVDSGLLTGSDLEKAESEVLY
jgi:TP901 family phage tail tape measure protein